MYRGFIFDLDGTLVDSRLDFADLARRLEVPYGSPLLEVVASWPEQKRKWGMEVIHQFEVEGAERSQVYPGVKEFLRFLEDSEIPVGLFTRNSRSTMLRTIEKHGLRFSICYAREDGPPKPSPHGLWKIQQEWKIPKDKILYVGDYLYDLQAGLAAEIPTAIYESSPTDFDTNGARYIFRDYQWLTSLVVEGSRAVEERSAAD